LNIRDLESRIAEIGETAVIGEGRLDRRYRAGDSGTGEDRGTRRLVALLYDEEWRDRQEAREADGPVDAGCLQPTLRERLRPQWTIGCRIRFIVQPKSGSETAPLQ
jgi:hypothetical protein